MMLIIFNVLFEFPQLDIIMATCFANPKFAKLWSVLPCDLKYVVFKYFRRYSFPVKVHAPLQHVSGGIFAYERVSVFEDERVTTYYDVSGTSYTLPHFSHDIRKCGEAVTFMFNNILYAQFPRGLRSSDDQIEMLYCTTTTNCSLYCSKSFAVLDIYPDAAGVLIIRPNTVPESLTFASCADEPFPPGTWQKAANAMRVALKHTSSSSIWLFDYSGVRIVTSQLSVVLDMPPDKLSIALSDTVLFAYLFDRNGTFVLHSMNLFDYTWLQTINMFSTRNTLQTTVIPESDIIETCTQGKLVVHHEVGTYKSSYVV